MVDYSADLAAYFINQFNRENKGKQPNFSHEALKKLLAMNCERDAEFAKIHTNMKQSIMD